MEGIHEVWISGKKTALGYEQSFKGVIPTSSPLWKPENEYFGMNGECSYIKRSDFSLKTWKCDAPSYAICQMKPRPGITEQIFN